MSRNSRVAVIALAGVAVTACGSVPETMNEQQIEQVLEQWSEPVEPVPAPAKLEIIAPDGRSIPLPPMARDPAGLSSRFLVILASSSTPGTRPESLMRLADHPALLESVSRASSSWLEGLMPCYEITMAGAFEHRRQATTLSRQLDALGIDNYVKQAGRYVGPQAVVEAWCHADHGALTADCGDARFAELHDGVAWMWLPQEQLVIDRALEGSAAPEPLGDLTAWSSPIGAETIEPYQLGDKWKVYAPVSAKALGRCKIQSFSAITRGQPHFGYLGQTPPPTAPGCGQPELFAKLSCQDAPDEPLIALPTSHGDPVLYTALAPLRDIELEDDAKVIVARSPAFTPVFERAREQATELSMPLQQLVTLRGFVAADRKVLLVQVTLQTGDGEVWCGSDDVRQELAAVYEWTQDGTIGAELVPFYALDLAEVIGLIDVDNDGTPEILQRRWPQELQLVGGGTEQGCTAPRDYCDCPC